MTKLHPWVAASDRAGYSLLYKKLFLYRTMLSVSVAWRLCVKLDSPRQDREESKASHPELTLQVFDVAAQALDLPAEFFSHFGKLPLEFGNFVARDTR